MNVMVGSGKPQPCGKLVRFFQSAAAVGPNGGCSGRPVGQFLAERSSVQAAEDSVVTVQLRV